MRGLLGPGMHESADAIEDPDLSLRDLQQPSADLIQPPAAGVGGGVAAAGVTGRGKAGAAAGGVKGASENGCLSLCMADFCASSSHSYTQEITQHSTR